MRDLRRARGPTPQTKDLRFLQRRVYFFCMAGRWKTWVCLFTFEFGFILFSRIQNRNKYAQMQLFQAFQVNEVVTKHHPPNVGPVTVPQPFQKVTKN